MRRGVFLLIGALTLVLGTSATAPAADAVSHLLMFDDDAGRWFMTNADGSVNNFYFGTPGDTPLLGDWDCDGEDTVGAYRPTTGFVYVRNSNTQGIADNEFFFGDAGDIPLAGDWDGDGCDTVSIYRNGEVFVNNALQTANAAYSFFFGVPGDTPFAGDFDGDGIDEIGLHRATTGFVYLRNTLDTGIADHEFFYGIPGDTILAGDWNEDGLDTVGIYRPADQRFYLSNLNETGPADTEVDFASDGWVAAGRAAPGIIFDVAIVPGQSIQAAVDANPNGTTFLIRTGLHRNQSIRPKEGQVFVGEPGAILTGAEDITGFAPDGSWWSVGGQTRNERISGHCEEGFPRCNHTNDLFVDDVTFRHVGSINDLGPGKWFFDYGADRIYLGEDPAGRRVEMSVTERGFWGDADNVRIFDLIVEKYAVRAQVAAVDSRNGVGNGLASGWIVDGVETRLNHGVGINVTNGGIARNNYSHHNGQLGISAQGNTAFIENNEISYNNTAGFWLDWEAGGTKFAVIDDVEVRDNYVHHNYGMGLWVDIHSRNSLIENNRSEYNYRSGISVEKSYGTTIRYNHLEGNGLDDPRGVMWMWSAGILVYVTTDAEVYGNTVVNNANGIAAVQQNRGSGPDGENIVVNLHVYDNDITMERGYTGAVKDWGDDAMFNSRNNRFENNTYHGRVDDHQFRWRNVYFNFAGWQAQGHDTTGAIFPL
ncbi:MAG: right-handed parallel beta-helix repeat-containing protein [Acidimicrobiia bacterium]|nr:right-handed parallel beta-helix repeat-containing protein [Acidimicrobiia bacterium]